MRFDLLCVSIAVSVLLLSACGSNPEGGEEFEVFPPENPQPRGERVFGICVSESEQGFQASFEVAREAGIQRIELNLPWDSIETSEGRYQDPGGVLEAISFYGYYGIDVGLCLSVINTVERTTPDYLDGYPYNSPEVITAFENMVDWVMDQVPSNVTIAYVAIGNEVDLVLDGSGWDDYTGFYQATASYVRQNYPTVKVGVKATVENGLFGGELSRVQTINQYSDVIMLNYYPQDAQFRVYSPGVVHDDFADVVSYFPSKNIWLTELGYQSGSDHCGSSETRQAEFYHEMFTAWDDNRERIEFVLVDWLHDQSPELIEQWLEYYGSSDPGFVEYLSTLGLRNHDHTDKYAWLQVLAETEARGW